MVAQNKRLLGILATILVILLIPLVAMQFSNEVNWKLNDFTMAGILLLGTGLIIELVLRKVKKKEHRKIVVLVTLVLLLLVWIELAVGIFGSPLAGR